MGWNTNGRVQRVDFHLSCLFKSKLFLPEFSHRHFYKRKDKRVRLRTKDWACHGEQSLKQQKHLRCFCDERSPEDWSTRRAGFKLGHELNTDLQTEQARDIGSSRKGEGKGRHEQCMARRTQGRLVSFHLGMLGAVELMLPRAASSDLRSWNHTMPGLPCHKPSLQSLGS